MQTPARKVAILKYTKIETYTNNIQNFIEANLKANLIHSQKRRGICEQSLIQESPNTGREAQWFEKT